MCQKLQEEAKPKKNKMDKSIQKGFRKGTDSGEAINYKSEIAEIFFWFCIAHLKTLFQDNCFEFEKRRNAPVKYNRNLWEKTGNVSTILLSNCC